MPLNYGDAIPIAEFHRPPALSRGAGEGRLRFYAKSGGVASVTNAFTASSSVIIVFAWLPSRRMLTVPSSASRLPSARITGTLGITVTPYQLQ